MGREGACLSRDPFGRSNRQEHIRALSPASHSSLRLIGQPQGEDNRRDLAITRPSLSHWMSHPMNYVHTPLFGREPCHMNQRESVQVGIVPSANWLPS